MRLVFGVSSLLLLLLLQESHGFLSQKTLSFRASDRARVTTFARWPIKQKQKDKSTTSTTTTTLVKDPPPIVNGEPAEHHASHVPANINVTSTTLSKTDEHGNAAENVVQIMEEVNRYIEDGSREMFGNVTAVMEEQLKMLPDDAAKEMSTYLYDMTAQVQKTQMQEVERQLKAIEREMVRPLEELAFSDAELYKETNKMKQVSPEVAEQRKLEMVGQQRSNETMQETSRRLRTREIIRNINVAPYYYTVALLIRWFRKLWEPPLFFLNWMRGMASIIKLPQPRKRGETYEEYLKDAELMQAGWKRTGEIAAKGPMARRWAILRRSAEIWAYFSSFYIKERRMYNKYRSGRWTAEQFSEGRSKLGAEVTQNLLKLGPTFIKVSLITVSLLPSMLQRLIFVFFVASTGWSVVFHED
jgi:hypothetical protein